MPLGAPVWIEKGGHNPLRRLMIAQDTGSAIKGAQRADIFFGTGDKAGRVGRPGAGPGPHDRADADPARLCPGSGRSGMTKRGPRGLTPEEQALWNKVTERTTADAPERTAPVNTTH